MRKYLSIFNLRTLIVAVLSVASSAYCVYFHVSLYLDFLILGLMIAFPLTFSLGAAFKRRERALQYISLFKASLQSVYYVFKDAKLDDEKKNEFENVARGMSEKLLEYLLTGAGSSSVQDLSHAVYNFVQANKEHLKRTFASKLFFFLFRLNESIEFLIATKRHRTPWGVRTIVLVVVYSFVIMYPASLLHDVGFNVPLWYVVLQTGVKGLIIISLYNVQTLLEDPFNQAGPDAIRVDDFRFSPVDTPEPAAAPVPIVEMAPGFEVDPLSDEE